MSLNRRNALRGGAALLGAVSCSAAWASQPLRVLAWPGYADADVVKAFEAQTGAKVEVTFIASDAAMWGRISARNGQDFDVFAANTAELQRYIRQGLAVPINTSAIERTQLQLPRFRHLAGIAGLVHQGQVFGVPYTYADMGLIYDRRQLTQAPTSIHALWDPRWRGKVLAYNGGTHNFSLAAQALGLSNPFQLPNLAWPVLVQKLIDLRRNVVAFYTAPEESVRLFKARKAALMLANYGTQQVQLLRAVGVDVGYALPSEGALAWLDCWAVTRGNQHPALALAWINHMLGPEASQALVQRQGLANTTTEAPEGRSGDVRVWLQAVESEDKREALWARIVSGDSLKRVLAP